MIVTITRKLKAGDIERSDTTSVKISSFVEGQPAGDTIFDCLRSGDIATMLLVVNKEIKEYEKIDFSINISISKGGEDE